MALTNAERQRLHRQRSKAAHRTRLSVDLAASVKARLDRLAARDGTTIRETLERVILAAPLPSNETAEPLPSNETADEPEALARLREELIDPAKDWGANRYTIQEDGRVDGVNSKQKAEGGNSSDYWFSQTKTRTRGRPVKHAAERSLIELDRSSIQKGHTICSTREAARLLTADGIKVSASTVRNIRSRASYLDALVAG